MHTASSRCLFNSGWRYLDIQQIVPQMKTSVYNDSWLAMQHSITQMFSLHIKIYWLYDDKCSDRFHLQPKHPHVWISYFLGRSLSVVDLYTVTLSKPLAMPPFLQFVKYSPAAKRGGGSGLKGTTHPFPSHGKKECLLRGLCSVWYTTIWNQAQSKCYVF